MLLAHAGNAAFLQQQLARLACVLYKTKSKSFLLLVCWFSQLKILWHMAFLNASQILTTLFLV